MTERVLHTSVKKRLINNEPFAYAHLIKFERPFAQHTRGLASTDAKRYGYFSDATFNISYDDGTTDVLGVSNGAQTYYADKVFKVAGFSENTAPKATSMSLELAAESLYNSVTASMTMTTTEITAAGINFMEEGFREGDKLLISGGTNSGHEVKLTGIKGNGTILIVSNIDSTLATQSSAATTTIKIVSDELKGPLIEIDNQTNLKSYYNRRVSIFKVFLDPTDNSIIGAPYLIFKGLINKTDIIDNPTGGLRVKWYITSHWGDFVQVNGRQSNDSIHRALNQDGFPQPEVTKKEAYAWDTGFAHAEDTVNILATYVTSEEQTLYRSKRKFMSLISTTKQYTETVDTTHDVKLNFSLSSKYIPVVYGVDKVAGRPVFVDTKVNNPNDIYKVDMICEGEIGGIYDVYIDGKPNICFNKEDYDERNSTNGTAVDDAGIVCVGRADTGQTLGGAIMSGRASEGGSLVNSSGEVMWDVVNEANTFGGDAQNMEKAESFPNGPSKYHSVNHTLAATVTSADGQGITHRQSHKFVAPNEIEMTFHAGKEDQLADNTLLEVQASPGFKRGTDYYSGGEIYVNTNFRLLDTAYAVNYIKIDEDATTVPEMEYVVRGKLIDCCNYDYSYQQDKINDSGESAGNFAVGDSVTLYRTDTDAVLNADVFIIDKWSMIGANGVEEYRFRFSDAPDLNYTDGIAAIKQFYMKKSSNTWHMWTHDIPILSGTVATKAEITSTATTVPTNSEPTWTFASDAIADKILSDTTVINTFDDIFNMGKSDGWIAEYGDTQVTIYDQLSVKITGTGPYVATAPTGSVGTGHLTDQTQTFIDANGIIFPSGGGISSTDDAYNGMVIKLYEKDANNNVTIQERVIEDYDGGDRYATIGISWDAGNAPKAKTGSVYTYEIVPNSGDRRVSINPAMQLMDFITSSVYGKGLDPDEELSKSDWLRAARVCDTRGTQTLAISSGSATAGDRFALTSDGTTDGTIVSIGRVQATISSATSIIMEECFGNFVKEFQKNSTYYSVGDIIWTPQGYFRCTSAGYKTARPTSSSHSGWSAVMTTVPIYKLGQSGSANTKITTITSASLSIAQATNSQTYKINPVTYSLYDSSVVKYWRYLGWEDHHQRWVTRHQTCGTVDTANPVLDTVGGFLMHMNGMLSYEGGKYVLRIATSTDSIASTVVTAANSASGETYEGYTPGSESNIRWVTEDDIIGTISLKDKGVSKAYNTVNSTIEMPHTQWEGKSVSFYDSNYLKADKMIVKSGTLNQPSVINYYNARINVENFLRQSRFGLSISFTMGPKALLLRAGITIAITHDKFDWSGKVFRITSINYTSDCTANITAEEYNDSFYSISPPSLPSILNQDFRAPLEAAPGTPTNLAASAGAAGSINLTWTKASGTTANSETEIWVNSSNSQYGTILSTVKGNIQSFQHNVGLDGAQRYYWIRHKKTVWKRGKARLFYGAYHGSVNATTIIPSSLYQAILQANAQTFQVNTSNAITAPSDITFTLTRHNLAGTGGDTGAIAFSTSPSVTLTGSGDTRVLSAANFGSNTAVAVTVTVTSTTAERAGGADNTYTSTVYITRSVAGADGSPGSTGTATKTASGQVFYNSESASAPTAPSNSSVAFNFSTGIMTGGVMGSGGTDWSLTPPTASGGAGTSKIWYVYYFVAESSAGSGTGQPTFTPATGNSLQGTGFTNLVTFSSGQFSQAGTGITTIDGDHITTGSLKSADHSGTADGSDFSSAGTIINLNNGSISSKKFRIEADGDAEFSGALSAATGTFSGALSAATGTFNGSISAASGTFTGATTGAHTGTVGGTAASTVASGAASGATAQQNNSNKTGGQVAGWTIDGSKISNTYIEIDNTNARILIKEA